MTHLDTLSNLLSHIQNGQKNGVLVIEYKNSRKVVALLNILQSSGYIRGYRWAPRTGGPQQDPTEPPQVKVGGRISILLRYLNEKPAIGKAIRISKPSRRVYLDVNQLASFLCVRAKGQGAHTGGEISHEGLMQGTLILSTPKGIMSGTAAYKLNVGGELLARITSCRLGA